MWIPFSEPSCKIRAIQLFRRWYSLNGLTLLKRTTWSQNRHSAYSNINCSVNGDGRMQVFVGTYNINNTNSMKRALLRVIGDIIHLNLKKRLSGTLSNFIRITLCLHMPNRSAIEQNEFFSFSTFLPDKTKQKDKTNVEGKFYSTYFYLLITSGKVIEIQFSFLSDRCRKHWGIQIY